MNIAILQLGRIGDLILVTSAINIIKNKYPDAKIDFIVGKSNEQVIRDNPDVSRIIVLDKSPIKLISFIYKVKQTLYDFYVDPKDHYSTESFIISKLIRAVVKVGFNKPNKKTFDISTPSDQDNYNLHFIERIANAFNKIGFETTKNTNKPNIFIPDNSRLFADNFLFSRQIKKYIIINLSASNENKMWLKHKWISLIFIMKNIIAKSKNSDTQIIITSEPKYATTVKAIAKRTQIKRLPRTNIINVAAIISNASMIITPDTSLVHIASAFNVPTIALTNNVPWSIIKFAPLSTKKIIIFPENNRLVKNISVKQVANAFFKMFNKVFPIKKN